TNAARIPVPAPAAIDPSRIMPWPTFIIWLPSCLTPASAALSPLENFESFRNSSTYARPARMSPPLPAAMLFRLSCDFRYLLELPSLPRLGLDQQILVRIGRWKKVSQRQVEHASRVQQVQPVSVRHPFAEFLAVDTALHDLRIDQMRQQFEERRQVVVSAGSIKDALHVAQVKLPVARLPNARDRGDVD